MPSESTLKQYAMRMAILKKDGIKPIENPQSLLSWLDTKAIGNSAQKVYLSAVKNSNPEAFPKALQDKLNELYTAQNKQDMEQKLTEKQEKNFLKWEDLMAVQKTLAEKSKGALSWKQFLVVSLYTLNPPVRADYGEVEVHTRRSKTRTGNELIWNTKPVFVFRKYKTAKTYGTVELPIEAPLVEVIRQWFEVLGGVPKYLLGETASNPNTFAVFVADTFRRYTGKDIGVSLLRHSFITHIYPSLRSRERKDAMARRMLHSTDRQELYISLADMD